MEGVLRNLIRPALEILRPSLAAKSILDCSVTGDINQAIVEELRDSRLVIADLSELNPNVMYEFGVRCAWNLPLVSIAPQGLILPFDLHARNTVFYDLKKGVAAAVKTIADLSKAALESMPHDRSTLFGGAMRTLCGGCALDAVFAAKSKVLNGLIQTLDTVKTEMEKDFEKENEPGVLKRYGDMIRPAFSALRERSLGLEAVVRNCDTTHAPTDHAKSVCESIKKLQRDGGKLDAYVSAKGRIARRFSKAIGRIDNIIGTIEKIIENLG